MWGVKITNSATFGCRLLHIAAPGLEFAVTLLFKVKHQTPWPLGAGVVLSTLPAHSVYPALVTCLTS